MLISQQENIMWVSKQMGHATMEITLKRYARWIPEGGRTGGYQFHHNWEKHLDSDVNSCQNYDLKLTISSGGMMR